jgi:hypothetical protein
MNNTWPPPVHVFGAFVAFSFFACGNADEPRSFQPLRPEDAIEVAIDRFAPGTGMLQVRSASNGLPGPSEPVDFDRAPFITRGLGPNGERVAYYKVDVQPTAPAPIYVFLREGESAPVPGQLNVVDVIPGATGYSDFWQIQQVQVPADYVANTITSLAQLAASGYPIEPSEQLVNCPIVPAGSSARLRLNGADPGLRRGWYRGELVHYFSFDEGALSGAQVPTADIFVTFNVNPGADGGGPASGFKTEAGGEQTHNVLTALPDEAGYSPLWSVAPYDNEAFEQVSDLASLSAASVLARGVADVNCPVVGVD